VGDGEGVHVNIADGKTLPSLDRFDAAKALAESFREDAAKLLESRLGNIEWRFPDTKNLREAVAVVGVLVSDQDGVEAVEVAFDGGKAGQGFAFA